MLRLYTNPMSRGRIARWMLEETGQAYETILLDYATTMKGAEYLALNPMGKVPTLIHDDRVITECPAICTYLAETFPKAGLQGDDRASFLRWMFFAAGPLEAAVTNRALGVEIPDDKTPFVGYGNYDMVLDTLEKALNDREWLGGDGFSAVDLFLGAQVIFGLQFKTLPERTAFTRYRDRLISRPAYQRATATDDALMPKDDA
ncbi:MAG: glutathione S-transferase family protein [Pseudorhodobacter sp.]